MPQDGSQRQRHAVLELAGDVELDHSIIARSIMAGRGGRARGE
jgi:hypothetical protein